MATGKIVQFNDVRGFGFIAPDNGTEDIFVHANDLLDDKYLYRPGLRVSFEVEDGDRGLKASDVRLIGQGAAPPAVARPTASPFSTASKAGADDEGDLCDLLSTGEFQHELTEALLRTVRSLTAEQILRVRECVTELARAHSWIDS